MLAPVPWTLATHHCPNHERSNVASLGRSPQEFEKKRAGHGVFFNKKKLRMKDNIHNMELGGFSMDFFMFECLSLSIAVSMSPAGGWKRANARNKKEQVSMLACSLAASFRCSMPQAKLKFLHKSCVGETRQTSWEVHSCLNVFYLILGCLF